MFSRSRSNILALFILGMLAIGTSSARAVPAYDTPSVTVVDRTESYIAVDVTAGPSGAPNGFTIDWMKQSDYDANGGWPTDYSAPGYAWCTFDGAATLNMTTGVTYNLGPNQTVRVVLGELYDETGVSTNYLDEMSQNNQFVLRVHAEGDLGTLPSAYSLNSTLSTTPATNCTYTWGFWKNHGPVGCASGNNVNVWPGGATPMLLGNVLYTATQLCAIFNTAAAGNGLLSLAHQLIAAKLNLAYGANPTLISSTIAAADAQIGNLVIPPIGAGYLSPGSTSSKTNLLDLFNNGKNGPAHCSGDVVSARSTTWGNLKVRYH